MNENINNYCQDLEKEFHLIPATRKTDLLLLKNYISLKFEKKQIPKIIIICTHNSRRSHIGQLWLAIGADYYGLPAIQTFSGGTEATAFNIRAVKAFQRIGLTVESTDNSSNPVYAIKWNDAMQPYEAFSKKYEAAPNPKQDFAAIMVCTQADEGCPIVLGADFRLALPYDDPKAFDDTELESQKYDERIGQIGREILFVLKQLKP